MVVNLLGPREEILQLHLERLELSQSETADNRVVDLGYACVGAIQPASRQLVEGRLIRVRRLHQMRKDYSQLVMQRFQLGIALGNQSGGIPLDSSVCQVFELLTHLAIEIALIVLWVMHQRTQFAQAQMIQPVGHHVERGAFVAYHQHPFPAR